MNKRNRSTLAFALAGLCLPFGIAHADQGTPACEAKVKSQVDALTQKNGRHPSNEVRTNLLAKCSEAAVGVDLEGLFANHDLEKNSDKADRCETSAKFALDHGLDTGGRSREELVQLCLSLPSEHNPACGFPEDPDRYFVVENQRCVPKSAGLTGEVVAKTDGTRVHHYDTDQDGGTDDGEATDGQAADPSGSSAQ
jgi:hypothetical protein